MPPRPRALLSRQDWIDAGQELLREGGSTGVKLSPLLARLGVTSGSFYHHFDDFAGYLDALAEHYGTVHLDAITAAIDEVRPSQRLRELRRLMEAWQEPGLDKSMRVWATSNERAATAVQRLDARLLTILRDALVELGFGPEDARLRALLMFAAGAGQSMIFPPWEMKPDDARHALELLMTPPGADGVPSIQDPDPGPGA